MMNIHTTYGAFTWMWNDVFFISTHNENNEEENFIWSDPEYNGDNTIRAYSGSLQDYCAEHNISYGRGKGEHLISAYCGGNVVLL
jgi:hypothetical protein